MATSTISNTILDLEGNAVASVPVVVTLMPSGGFRSDTQTEVARQVTTTTDSNGLWSLSLERNSNIVPSGTFYVVDEHIPSDKGGATSHAIEVGVANESLRASLISNLPEFTNDNFLTQEAADARYQALGSLGSGTPVTIEPDDAGTAGVSTSASRADHEHPIAAATPVTVNVDGSGALAEGVSTSFARADHKHTAESNAWITWTPTLTNLTLGNGTVTARYTRVGRTIEFFFKFVCGSTSAVGTNPSFSPPVTTSDLYTTSNVDPIGLASLFDSGTAVYSGPCLWTNTTRFIIQYWNATGTPLLISSITATVPFTWTTGDVLVATGRYEAAS